MPGIVGIIERGSNQDRKAAIQAMVKCMLHEKTYTSGTYINEPMRLYAGWTCHKDSFADCLPIWNERRDICLLFAGENFAEPAEIDYLRSRGHEFEDGTASYLVHLYEEFGLKFVNRLNGWFNGLLVDTRESRLVLFNDRYGFRRTYIHQNNESFFFASEAKSLLRAVPELRQLDSVALGETVSCGCVLQNRTLFSGVSLLPGGSLIIFSGNEPPRRETYFKPENWENQERLPAEEYYDRLKETLARVVPRYFRAKQRVGISLTGGLDSRLAMAWGPAAPFRMRCYSFGGMYRKSADVRIARRVAAVCQQKHDTIAINRSFFSEFPALAKRAVLLSDGALDVSGAVELYVNRAAREIAPIRMTGCYGSEVLRGHVAFKPSSVNEEIFAPDLVSLGRQAGETYAEEARGRRLTFIAFKQVPWFHYSRLALEESQLTMRSPFLDNDLIATLYSAPSELNGGTDVSLRLVADGYPSLSRIPTDRGVVRQAIPVVTMVRRLFQELSDRAEYAYDYLMPQWLAHVDHTFARLHLERLFLGRHKFYHFRVWYRDNLANYVRDMLLDPRTRNRSYLQGVQVEKMVERHLSGKWNYTPEIHRLLTLELLQRHLIDSR